MRKFWNNQKGVTMIEVLVTIAILAIVVTPCLSAFVMAQRGNVKAAETQQAYTAAANLMEELKGGTKSFEDVFESNVFYDDEKNFTAFLTPQEENEPEYYIVTIYAGEYELEAEIPEGVEPILKGVIAP